MALSSSIICVLLCSFVFWYQPSDERCVAGTERYGTFQAVLITEQEVFMGESLPRLPVQNEHSEVCTSDGGQDSPIQTDLARLRRCLLYGQTRKQRNKNINNFICFPARAQAFSWLSSVTGLQSKRNKNNCSKSSFVQTLYKQANLFIFFVCNFLRRTVTTRSV